MTSLKRLARIKRIYEIRAQNAERIAAERAALREGLEGERDEMGRVLQDEVDNCDSLVRAPFDYAARYYRASLKRIAVQEGVIDEACESEVAAREDLQRRYVEKKEFEVYYDRTADARKAEKRAKRDQQAREQTAVPGEEDEGANIAADWAGIE